jgi:Lamin Tail Domain
VPHGQSSRRCIRAPLASFLTHPHDAAVIPTPHAPDLHQVSLGASMFRARILVFVFAAVTMGGVFAAAMPGPIAAASCVRISGGVFDAPGNDNYMPQLNGEFIRVHNYCSSAKSLTGWHLNDYGNKHRYAFPSGFRLGANATVTIYSGTGSRTSTRLYWNRGYGAVWNNTPPERAYLRSSAGTLVSSWSLY